MSPNEVRRLSGIALVSTAKPNHKSDLLEFLA
jgi:hypothetical protein